MGEILGGDVCAMQEWKNTAEPAGPLGATMPCCFARTPTVLESIVYSGVSAGISSAFDDSFPSRCDPGMNAMGPLNSVTSSRKTA